MATTAILQAAIAEAQASGMSWSDLALLARRAIANAFVDDTGNMSVPWTQTGANGVSITRVPLKDMIALAQKFESADSGGVVSVLVTG